VLSTAPEKWFINPFITHGLLYKWVTMKSLHKKDHNYEPIIKNWFTNNRFIHNRLINHVGFFSSMLRHSEDRPGIAASSRRTLTACVLIKQQNNVDAMLAFLTSTSMTEMTKWTMCWCHSCNTSCLFVVFTFTFLAAMDSKSWCCLGTVQQCVAWGCQRCKQCLV